MLSLIAEILLTGFLAIGLPLAVLLVAAFFIPPVREFWERPLPWVMAGLAYLAMVLVMALAVAFDTGRTQFREDGDCGTVSGWAADHASPGSVLTTESVGWPPFGTRCVVTGPHGRFETTFPTTAEWAWVGYALIWPFALWPVARRLTRTGRFETLVA